jgi:DNA-directed RNA polymerase subunit beta'
MGHIELAVPIAHIWFLRKSPSRIGMFLDLPLKDIEKIAYYIRYVVLSDIELQEEDRARLQKIITDMEQSKDDQTVISELKGLVDRGKIPARTLVSIESAQELKYVLKDRIKIDIGAGAIRKFLEKIDLKEELQNLRNNLAKTQADVERSRLTRRIRVLEGFIKSNMRPEWMVIAVLPVIPPDLRPLVPLEGGRFATSDLNDLYRRIINRNNRLKHIQSLKAPEIMINNEKRLLQEAVDALIENGSKANPVVGAGNRPLKSFSDILKGKHGRFRQNLLGKRVDYSGRSVIVVGPTLKLHQCGLPKEMAIELFKPFIIRELMKRENVTLKAAKRTLEKQRPEIWNILEEIITKHPILLNRAPTLHRISIQAFDPILVEGKAIQLHPLTCAAFNADFDGDQMAVHVPLSTEAQLEARLLMLSVNNILSPASGKPIAIANQDIVLGCAYLTRVKNGEKGEGMIFSTGDEVLAAHQRDVINLHAKIKVRGFNKIIEDDLPEQDKYSTEKWKDYTTCGRIIFNEVVPEELRLIDGKPQYNKVIGKREVVELTERCYHQLGHYRTVVLLDDLKKLGYKYATISGISISVSEMKIPPEKKELIKKAQQQVDEIKRQAHAGLITEVERYNRIIDIWTRVTDRIAKLMFVEMEKDESKPFNPGESRFNSVYLMANSGARGNQQQVRQLAGMRGLMARPQKKITGQVGEIIESPIKSNFREGLSVLEYFISTHGGRKGLADTALKTADAGYLTRRLVDVAHNVVVMENDCNTINGVRIGVLQSGEEVIEPFKERIAGRVALDNVVWIVNDPVTGEPKEEIIVREGDMITPHQSDKIAQAGIEQIRIRSVLTCESEYGVCAKCYGINLATGRPVEVGEAVGIIAAQSIGEPGTQLTLRTFHIGGTASRVVKSTQITAERDSVVKFHNLKAVKNKKGDLVVLTRTSEAILSEIGTKRRDVFKLNFGASLKTENNQKVKKGEIIAEWDPYVMPIIAEYEGRVKYEDIIEGKTMHQEKTKVTGRVERTIIECRTEKLHPQIAIMKGGKRLATYPLPMDTLLSAENGDEVGVGEVIAKIPQEVIKTKDITGGLPRVSELFEARHLKNAAVVSEIDGAVMLGLTDKGTPKITVKNEQSEMEIEYPIPTGRHLMVYEGDKVGAGESLTDGAIDPHDILKVKSAKEVQEFLVNEIQQVYRLQGVIINDKHIEVIVRQMLSNVRITSPGSSNFLYGEIVPKRVYGMERRRLEALKKELLREKKKEEAKNVKIPEMQHVLLGITKASLFSESFLSAASFQETTRILTDAATLGQVDYLRGLKENVIIGHLIPAGTGLAAEKIKERVA